MAGKGNVTQLSNIKSRKQFMLFVPILTILLKFRSVGTLLNLK